MPFLAAVFTDLLTNTSVNNVGWDEVDTATLAYGNWWCSNGLYRYITATNVGILNNTQPLLGTQNQRMAITFAAYPLFKALCGTVDVI